MAKRIPSQKMRHYDSFTYSNDDKMSFLLKNDVTAWRKIELCVVISYHPCYILTREKVYLFK
ncbi:hypothetical protein [Kordia jejudonensis]|uniref:hypothetical protein n=1 Tax=Kordia jejudonensis TaxID=1348245 RepID=UPI0006294DBD|nr:hypothetical protein [Kordia jejudonensis]